MIRDVLETYRCLLSHRKNLPGNSIENIFPDQRSIDSLEKEEQWLKKLEIAIQGFTESI